MNDAWSELVGMSQMEAQRVYVGLIEEHCPFWRSGSCGGSRSWAVGSVPVNIIGDSLDKDESQIGEFCELCAQGNLVEVEVELEKDGSLLCRADREGLTCLHWASDRGHQELAKVLIQRKCDINKQDDSGNTALHLAVMADQSEIVRLLLDAKADPTLVNSEGETAINLIRKEYPIIF
jgi:ankyrin repeat protein